MKKSVLTVLALGMIGVSVLFTSCDKVKDAVKINIPLQMVDVAYQIPAVPITGDTVFTSVSVPVNIDSTIKAYNSSVGVKNIKSAKMNFCHIVLVEHDSLNNLANLQSLKISFSSDNNPTPVTVAEVPNNPDVAAYEIDVPVNQDVDLKEYFTGTKFSYRVAGNLRRPITSPINIKVTFKFNVEAGLE